MAMYMRRCPICGDPVDIRIVLREYGFNGVIIECKNCGISLREGKCAEQICTDGITATPVTEKSLSDCLFRAIARWNGRSKRANNEPIGYTIRKDAKDWLEHRRDDNG